MQEELDVKTLQSEINSHMSLLGSENGDKAQIAAFKGYALLKKISALDKIDYVGKLDEEIAQKLKVTYVAKCSRSFLFYIFFKGGGGGVQP